METYFEDIESTQCRYGTISYFKNDEIIGRSLREYGEWAQAEIDLLLKLIDIGDTVIDVGAFIGTHTLAFAQRVGITGNVYAFEPQSNVFELLSLNVKNNELSNVKLFNTALSARTGSIYINSSDLVDMENPGSFSLCSKQETTNVDKAIPPIKLAPLDKYKIRKCELIKLDVEGMEYDVLKGASKTIKQLQPLIFAECLSIENGWKAISFIKDLGFKVFLHNERSYNPNNFKKNEINFLYDARETNLLFIPEYRLSILKKNLNSFNFLIPINTLDDLALGLLKKPQYKYEILAKTDAAKVISIDLLVNESEFKEIKDKAEQVLSLEKKVQELSTEIKQYNLRIIEITNAIKHKDLEIEILTENDKEKNDKLEKLKYLLESENNQLNILQSNIVEKSNRIDELNILLKAKESKISEISNHLQTKESRIEELESNLDVKNKQISEFNNSIQTKDAQITKLNAELNERIFQVNKLHTQIQQSIVMKFQSKYQNLVEIILRPGTKRRHYYELILTAIRIILNEGWCSFWSKFIQWLRKPKESQKRSEITLLVPPSSSELTSDFEKLSQCITDTNRDRIKSLKLSHPNIISCNEKNLLYHAKSLIFPNFEKPEVSIILLNCNNEKLTIECLTSILKNTKNITYEIIIIDQVSSKITSEILNSIKNIKYLQNQQTSDLLFSLNHAAHDVKGEFILFLNNSIQVSEGWLKPLVETFSKYDNVGAVGPKIIYPDGRLRAAGCRIELDATGSYIGNLDDPEIPRFNYYRDVEYCSRSCLLLRTAKFRELTGFDVNFKPGYLEDADLCFRLHQQGLRTIFNPKVIVVQNLESEVIENPNQKEPLKIQNSQIFCEKWNYQINNFNHVKLIAYYLPQYHPIPENDLWWGKGFTEWSNVTKAKPNFEGHYQPHLPSDLGFYDLRVEEVMEQQAKLAKKYGIYGFCYYYYWFGGKRLLEVPLERMLKTGKPDIPFCLCWANESWTRRWDGQEYDYLIAQKHSEDDDRAVITDIIRYMRHPNYIRVNGKPLLLIYRAGLFQDIKHTTKIWRDICRSEGVGELYLAMEEAFEHANSIINPMNYGFDASIERPLFQMPGKTNPPGKILNPSYTGDVYDYRDLVLMYCQKVIPNYVRFRSAIVSWDNTPRQQNSSRIFINSSPEAYQAWLELIIKQTQDQNFGEERLVFINAWNEWAEGSHLEPDQRYGHGFLDATLNALEHNLSKKTTNHTGL